MNSSLTGNFVVERHLDARALDTASECLLAELALNDIASVQATHKGKSPESTVRSDEDIALDLQAASLTAYIGELNDHCFAASIDRALESDARQIGRLALFDRVEQDDHRAAVALRDGHDLPQQTLSQQMIEQIPCRTASIRSSVPVFHEHASDTGVMNVEALTTSMENVYISTQPSRPTSRESQERLEKVPECVICGDAIVVHHSFQAPCNHYYCRDCLVNLVETSLRDETLHPLRCCKKGLPLELGVFRFISIALQSQFRTKSREFSTPAASRVYCCNPRCSAFLEASGHIKRGLFCQDCHTITCSQCKNKMHFAENCSEYQSTLQLRETAAENKWQTCPGCHAIVELSQGCYHITCRCSTQFCYLCAAKWKTCDCRQWDEDLLLSDAERRVRNQFGDRAAQAQPAVYVERVHQRMETLRVNHECRNHHWTYRRGSGMCEECGDSLPLFLMRCIHCQTLVCRRCSVNRL